MKKKAYMILDLQFGSTGKGLLAGYLAEKNKPDVVVTAWGPNAGHTYIDNRSRTFIHRMLANGIVSPNLTHVLIGPGSVIDIDVLMDEIIKCKDLLIGRSIVIHPHAAIVTAKHRDLEKSNVKIGSTMKGTGAAVIERIQRDPDNNNVAMNVIPSSYLDEIAYMGIGILIDESVYRLALANARVIQIEGAQGFSLSIYHGLYPYTTSRDVTPAQVMADCAIPYDIKPEVYGTLRTYPIRVSNRFDEAGKMIGTSGPGYPDQVEYDWEDLGLPVERTTVTNLPRRIFSFSRMQLREALYQCDPDVLFLNFANYMDRDQIKSLMRLIEQEAMDMDCKAILGWIGVGPRSEDVLTTAEFLVRQNKEALE